MLPDEGELAIVLLRTRKYLYYRYICTYAAGQAEAQWSMASTEM